MTRVPRSAEIIMQTVLLCALGGVFMFSNAQIWLNFVVNIMVINIIIHLITMYVENKKRTSGLEKEEKKNFNLETFYTLDVKKSNLLPLAYITEVLACIVVIIPGIKYTLFEQNALAMIKYYQNDFSLLSIFIFLMFAHIIMNINYTYQLTKSYKEGLFYEVKTKKEYGEMMNSIIENVINEEVYEYRENIDVYNEKVKKLVNELNEGINQEMEEKKKIELVHKFLEK